MSLFLLLSRQAGDGKLLFKGKAELPWCRQDMTLYPVSRAHPGPVSAIMLAYDWSAEEIRGSDWLLGPEQGSLGVKSKCQQCLGAGAGPRP